MKISKVYDAKSILNNVAYVTPCIHAKKIKENLFLKCENMQFSGSFKLRGAYYRIQQLTNSQLKKGIICASAGNHAQGVAFAANKLNVVANIVMPISTPISKIEATKQFNGNVILYGENFNEAYDYAKKLQQKNDYVFIEPFDDEDVIIGQGTIALELLEQLHDIDTVFVPIGGGGLISGIAFVLKNLKPSIKIIGVQTTQTPSMIISVQENTPCIVKKQYTIADGINVTQPGEITFSLVKQYVDAFIKVSEDEIAASILTLLETMKLTSEGAGAVALAGYLYHYQPLPHEKCVCIISGGNIDVNLLSKIIDLGLSKTGRKLRFSIEIDDKSGALIKILDIIKNHNGNVLDIHHTRYDQNLLTHKAFVSFHIETMNQEHADEILSELIKNQYYPLCNL